MRIHPPALALSLSLLLPLALASSLSQAREPIRTNEVNCPNPPAWLSDAKIEKVVSHVQDVLEWNIRRIQLLWHTSEAEFESVHGFGPSVLAVTFKNQNTVHMGPQITRENFEPVFGHELTHVVFFQKFGSAIPPWLEEGLANWVGKKGRVDYAWLAAQPPRDVTQLTHPFAGLTTSGTTAQFHYMASTALAEMIAAKCNLEDLLQLSVGSKLSTYLDTTCGISDVNAEYTKWVKKKAARK